jgi:hypothetical protein
MVTKQQAEEVFSKLKDHYRHNGWFDQPELIKDWKFIGWSDGAPVDYPTVDYAIVWEGGPDYWTHHATKIEVPGVYVEPYTSWALAIHEQ